MPAYGVEFVAHYRAWNTATNSYVTGDDGNHTLYWSKNGTASAVTNTPAEVDGSNAPGLYKITLTATEMQCISGALGGVSSTGSVSLFFSDIGPVHLPNAAPASNGGLPTVNASNYIAGIAGTLNVLDDLENIAVTDILSDGTALDTTSGVLDEVATVTNAVTVSGSVSANIIRSNTAQAGAASTITLDASASAANDIYNFAKIYISSGTGAGQTRYITDYVGSTKVATVHAPWTTTPDNTSVFNIVASNDLLLGQTSDLDNLSGTLSRLIIDKLGLITSTTSITTQGLISDGTVIEVIQGHTAEYTLALPYTGSDDIPDLSTYTARAGITKVTANSGTASLEIEPTVNNAGTANQSVSWTWTKAQTAAMALSTGGTHAIRVNKADYYAYTWTVSAFDGGTNCPVFAQGYVDVKASDTTCS